MSGKLVGQVYERKLSRAEQSVLVAMADHANDDGERCFPSVPFLAWKTDYSDRQVQRVMGLLRSRGALVVVRAATRYLPVEYKIVLAVLPMKPPFRGDILTPIGAPGVTPETARGDIAVSGRGDAAMSPEPPVNQKEPSKAFNPLPPENGLTEEGPGEGFTDLECETETVVIGGVEVVVPVGMMDADAFFPPDARPPALPQRPKITAHDPNAGVKAIIGQSTPGIEGIAETWFRREIGKYRTPRRSDVEQFTRLATDMNAGGWAWPEIEEQCLTFLRVKAEEGKSEYVTPTNFTAMFAGWMTDRHAAGQRVVAALR